jgi:hypothetical protein
MFIENMTKPLPNFLMPRYASFSLNCIQFGLWDKPFF